jgi:MATE family multidrug resistance protein
MQRLFQHLRKSSVLQIAIPMILSNISTPLLGLVDTIVLGHLNRVAYLGAVSIGAMILNVLYLSFGFLRMGTTGTVAQARGRKDGRKIKLILGQTLIVAFAISVLLVLLQVPIMRLALYWVPTSPEVGHLAEKYFYVRIWGAFPTLMLMVLFGWFLGMQNARIPLLVVTIANLVSAGLSIILVFYFGLTVAGVAWANVIAQYLGLVVGLRYLYKSLKSYSVKLHWRDYCCYKSLMQQFHVNKDIFIRTLCLIFTYSFFTAMSARFGTLVLAGNAVLLSLFNVVSYALDGFANAAEALVGRYFGAKNPVKVREMVWRAARWSTWSAVLLVLFFYTLGPLIITWMTSLSEVQELAKQLLPWLIISPIVSVWSFLFDGVFIGALWTKDMRNMMLLSVIGYLVAWFVLRPLGNNGLWLAFMIFLLFRGMSMGWCYRKNLVKE